MEDVKENGGRRTEDVMEDGGRRTEDVGLIPIIFETRRFNPFQDCGESPRYTICKIFPMSYCTRTFI